MAVKVHDTIQANIRQSDKVNSSLSIQLNGGTATVYNGSANKSINVTPAAIGAPTKTGGGASGNWGINITGNAATATLLQVTDSSTITTAKSTWRGDITNGYVVWGQRFIHSSLGTDAGDITLWVQSAGSNATQLNMSIDGTYYVNGNKPVLHSGNYTNYTVTKTGAGASGNWNINAAQANSLFLNPSSRQASADVNLGDAAYRSKVTYMLATSTMTTGKPPGDGHILTFGWDTTAGWGSQLAIGDAQTAHIYIRGANSVDNKSSWEAWRTVLDSGNYTSYTVTKTGGGASGNWNINIPWGNITGKPSTFAPSSHTHSVVQITWAASENLSVTGNGEWSIDMQANTSSYFHIWSGTKQASCMTFDNATATCQAPYGVYGGVWNDYAEFRPQEKELTPGYIVYCDDDGKLKYTTERLQKFEGVVSDTYGFAIGKNEENQTPLAVSGRVLVYTNPCEDFHSGDCVCAGPGGLAYKMTREEIAMYPDRIVGVVSEIPSYKIWGTGNVAVDGRIWIKVR